MIHPASLTRPCAAAVLAAAIAFSLPAGAEQLAAPAGEVVLTVSGAIGSPNVDGVLALDMAQLQSLPQQEFETTTIWTEGVTTFRGVLLKDVLSAAGATGTTLALTALNDYQIEMPAGDAGAQAPVIAYMMNGAEMSVRDKGPLWLVYPYDSNADFRTEQAYARSIWQLSRIEVID
ncbi:molybdopterin-dependent oxidoreductase [Neotabrizicola shimadae]|uniref:Molybdopterin-dependent oxidoreductase n=1 Tax=Neotabrizicola shimadae TaxID=2807096 RepID=A0A8G0ZTM6_9RHOB|nr:molybdopterin-dependent oxidoreductase [Neotabrizicola shimadae]QYZ69230.1 molybdopterin-dependent oxidoreductase [Neotabrizicola shimadae]